MKTKDQEVYRSLARVFDEARDKQMSVGVVAVVGMGISYLSKKYVAEHGGGKTAYICGRGEELGEFSILDLDLDEARIGGVDEYFRKATNEQKMAVIINRPGLMETRSFRESYFGRHLYRLETMRVMDITDCRLLVNSLKGGVVDEQLVKTIYELSGGLGQLIKYLCLQRLGSENVKVLSEDKMLKEIGQSIIDACRGARPDVLESMGVTERGEFKSWLLKEIGDEMQQVTDIVVGSDLAVWEDGEKTGNKIARVERDIIDKMNSNNGLISKEELAEIKWGGRQYSDFSDQAMNKAMRRISNKLVKYKIVTIRKTGYKLYRK